MQRALSSVLVILLVYVLPMPAHGGEGGGAHFDLGVFAYEDGDYESAEMHFKRAVEFSPSNPFYNHFLGKTYLRTARYEEAMRSLTKAWESDPNISGLKYDLALLNYKMSAFHRAASLFAEVAEEDPSNILAYYQAGISYYAEKDYRRALDYFLTAAEKSPTVRVNGHYYAGVCYWKMGDIEKAVEKFSFVRDHADSQLLRENAVVWLRRVEQDKMAVKPYTVSLKVGLHYDDNVPPEPEDQDLYSDEDDFVTKVYFTGKYNVINRKDYQIGAGYNHYHTWHNDWEEYDLIGSVFNIFGKYRLRQATFGLSYLPSYYWLDSDSYLRRHKLMPELIWRFSEDLSTRLSYSYRDDEHFQHDDRDGDAHEVVLEAYYGILDKRGHLFGSVGYEDKSASHPDQEYGWVKTKLGISLSLPWDLQCSLMGKYYNKQYEHVDSIFGEKREDSKYQGAASLSRKLFYDWLDVSLEFSYTRNSSNIDVYEYTRRTAFLSLSATY